MQKHLCQIVTIIISCYLTPHPLYAASHNDSNILDLPLEQLQDIVVTDTKVAQSQDTVTQRVEIIDANEMNRHPTLNRNLSELLMYRSGLFINTLSRNDANWGSFGGLGAKYNGYLLDGLPIDSFVDAMSLDPWAFERVELYKGPASIMYSNYLKMDFAGNETPLAGITNFVLRDRIEGPLTRLQVGGGSFGTMNGKVYHQDSKGKFNYFLGGNYEQSDYTNYGTPDSWLHILAAPDYQKGALYGKFSLLLSDDHTLSLFFHHTAHTGEVGRPNRDFNHGYDTVNLAYSNQLTKALNLQLKGGYRGYDRRWGEDNFPTNLDLNRHDGNEQQIFPVDLSFNVKHLANSLLTFGADAQLADYKDHTETNSANNTNNQVSAQSHGIFLQEKLLLNQWVLRAGGRFNNTKHSYDTINGAAPTGTTEQDWSQPLWSLGARFNATAAVALYTNIGTSFVVPSAQQIWGTISNPSPAAGQLPNPGLQEERGMGSDLGIEWRPNERLTIGMRGFMNQLDDAIIQNVVSLTPSQSQSVNAGEASSYGAEVTLDHQINNDLHWFANLTYTASEVTNPTDQDNDGTNIPFVPDWMANVGLTASLPYEITLSPYLHLVGNYYDSTSHSGRNEFGSYTTANIKVERPLLKKTGYTANAFMDVTNLTNERFEMPWGFRDPGFALFVGLSATIF